MLIYFVLGIVSFIILVVLFFYGPAIIYFRRRKKELSEEFKDELVKTHKSIMEDSTGDEMTNEERINNTVEYLAEPPDMSDPLDKIIQDELTRAEKIERADEEYTCPDYPMKNIK